MDKTGNSSAKWFQSSKLSEAKINTAIKRLQRICSEKGTETKPFQSSPIRSVVRSVSIPSRILNCETNPTPPRRFSKTSSSFLEPCPDCQVPRRTAPSFAAVALGRWVVIRHSRHGPASSNCCYGSSVLNRTKWRHQDRCCAAWGMAALEVGDRHNEQRGEGDLLDHQSSTAWLLRRICIHEDGADVRRDRRCAEERGRVRGEEADCSNARSGLGCAGTDRFDLRMRRR